MIVYNIKHCAWETDSYYGVRALLDTLRIGKYTYERFIQVDNNGDFPGTNYREYSATQPINVITSRLFV